MELLELSKHLKQEKLFVNSERKQLQSLNWEVNRTAEQLSHLAWINGQQRHFLDRLIRAEVGATPESCCHTSNDIEIVNFVDGHKCLNHHEIKVGEFLKKIRENPKLLAACLLQLEQISQEKMQRTVHLLISSLYANSVLPEDETLILQLLKSLIDLQVAVNPDPRRLLRKASCAFSVVFKLLNEAMFSARHFLTATLHEPIMELLKQDGWFYDIDPERALHRFPPHERSKRFSNPGTNEYDQKTKTYRETTNKQLAKLTENFIRSLQSNMFCFPKSLAWVIQHLYRGVIKNNQMELSEARAMCADLVFASFICPAICDPEPYSITSDAPISYIARHNLMQVAQILQVLAMSSGVGDFEQKTKDLYENFDKGCLTALMDNLLECSPADRPLIATQISGFSRSAVLITLSQLNFTFKTFREILDKLPPGSAERKTLEELLSLIPTIHALQVLQAQPLNASTPIGTPKSTPPGTPPNYKKSKGKNKRSRAHAGDMADGQAATQEQMEDVLVVTLGVSNDCPGMLPESKVIEQEKGLRRVRYNNYFPGEDDSASESNVPVHEKRTRFSLSHDQDSIGASDNLEAISEGASSHSVGSDLDNENDNLSDFVSANVSGRGTPNISGRDTPLSQAESQQEERQPGPDLPVIVRKTNREDVTDRFGKFDIKGELEKDDMLSTVSDAWSTDVLASDSEPPEQNMMDRLEEVAEVPEVMRQNLLGVQELSELSETASDAWSTDVLASDTSERPSERLRELDQDEVASVSSRSHGAPDIDDAASEQGEDVASASGEDPVRRSSDPFTVQSTSSGFNQNGVNRDTSRIERAPLKVDRLSDQTNYSSYPTGNNPFGNHLEYRNRVSDIVGSFHSIDANKHMHTPSSRVSASFKYAEGRVKDVLGNISTRFEKMELTENEGESKEAKSVVSPDQGIASPETLNPGSALSDAYSTSEALPSSDSGIPTTPQDNAMLDFDELKLTECQNVNLDANRLSAVSIFDPLLQDESSTDPIENGSASSGKLSTFFPPNSNPTTLYNPASYNEMGARPKVPQPMYSHANVTPRISLNDRDIKESAKIFQAPDSINSAGRLDVSKLDELSVENKRHSSGAESTESITKSSTGSSCSSLVDLSINSTNSSTTKERNIQLETPRQEKDESKRGESKKKQNGFFKNIFGKSAKKQRPSKEDLHADAEKVTSNHIDASNAPLVDLSQDDQSVFKPQNNNNKQFEDSMDYTDDILAKYRTNPGVNPVVVQLAPESSNMSQGGGQAEAVVLEDDDMTPAYDPSNLENCLAFLDAKRKLRMVLSNADLQSLNILGSSSHVHQMAPILVGAAAAGTPNNQKDNEVVGYLKVQLAEAINLQDKDLIAQLHESIRCLKQFDQDGVKKLLKVMKEEYRSRAPYIAYLVKCRQGLLSTQSHLDRLLKRLRRDKLVTNKYFLAVIVRLYMEKKERYLNRFISEFTKLTVPDEKTDLLEQFLKYLHQEMDSDNMWKAASENQIEEARVFIERTVMSHIYTHAIFPNGDIDVHRDGILYDHIAKLSKVITPNHKDLKIPRIYHYECPWPAAQNEISQINAYKTPKDKLNCIHRCSMTIMNLLKMASEKSVPAADDFMPVCIYVVIKANPRNLLSTVQYINSFYEKRLHGEDQYWWMQFCAVVEFIKTMEYTE